MLFIVFQVVLFLLVEFIILFVVWSDFFSLTYLCHIYVFFEYFIFSLVLSISLPLRMYLSWANIKSILYFWRSSSQKADFIYSWYACKPFAYKCWLYFVEFVWKHCIFYLFLELCRQVPSPLCLNLAWEGLNYGDLWF